MHTFYPLLAKFTPRPISRFLKSFLFYFKHSTASFVKKEFNPPKELQEVKTLTLIIGHSNFLEAQGGTEKILVEKAEALLEQGKDFLFIYPKGAGAKISFLKPRQYGLILNGFEIGSVHKNQLRSLAEKLQPQATQVEIYHWLFWPLQDLERFIDIFRTKAKPLTIHINDFYFHCPKVNYFCLSGGKVCQNSFYKSLIHWWRSKQVSLLNQANLVTAPSEFMRDFIPDSLLDKLAVTPPSLPPLETPAKKRLAYLGAASDIKGIQTWKKLANNALISRRYDLFQFGSDSGLPRVISVPYSYKNSKRNEATATLILHKIDYVLLWSQVPESFSFTFHEAFAANIQVLTSNKSGNITKLIERNYTHGKIFDSESRLLNFLFNLND